MTRLRYFVIIFIAVLGIIGGKLMISRADDSTDSYSQSSFTSDWSAYCIREKNAEKVNMTLSEGRFVEQHETVATSISANKVSVYPQYDTVLRFKAPYHGMVNIVATDGLTCQAKPENAVAEPDGMGFCVMVQNFVTGDKTIKVTEVIEPGTSYNLNLSDISVKAGDVIEFVYTDGGSGNSAYDVLQGTVCVVYTDIQKTPLQICQSTNGNIESDKSMGNPGEEVIVTVTPEEGYCLSANGLDITYKDRYGIKRQITPQRIGFQTEDKTNNQFKFIIPKDVDESVEILGQFVSDNEKTIGMYTGCDFSDNSDVIKVAFRFYDNETSVKKYGCIIAKTSKGRAASINQDVLLQKGKRIASKHAYDRANGYIDYSYEIYDASPEDYIVIMPYMIFSNGTEQYGEITYLNVQNQIAYTGARTFYVSNTDGDDNNDGLSPSTPWKTVSKATTMQYKPGDNILFKRGDVWYLSNESSENLQWCNLAGTSESVITLGAYGDGNNPAIYRSTSVVGGQDKRCIIFKNAEHLWIRNLDFGYANQGLTFFYTNNYAMSNVNISGCNFRQIYGTVQGDGLSLPYSSSILVDGDREMVGRICDAVLIGLNITDTHCADAGSLTGSATGGKRASGITGIVLKNLVIDSCTTESNGYYGTGISGVDGGQITNCKFNQSGSRNNSAGQAGIMLNCMNFTVNNTIVTNTLSPNGIDGCGIDFEQSCRNVLVDGCNISDNAGSGIMFYDSKISTGGNFDCKVKNCTFKNNSIGTSNNPDCHIFVVWSSARGYCLKSGEISNNTYSNNVSSFMRCRKTLFEQEISTLENVTIEHNQTS